MLLIFIKHNLLAKLHHFSVDLYAIISFAEKVIEHLVVLAFSADDNRRIDIHFLRAHVDAHYFFTFLCMIRHLLNNSLENFFL